MTLRPLQNWYEKMSSRERFMLLAFAWAAVILWGSLLTSQIRKLRSDVTLRQGQLKGQQASLNKKTAVEGKIKDYQQIFKTSISATALVTKVQQYVKQSEIPVPNISSGRVEGKKDAIFNLNTVSVHFNKTPFRNLGDFCRLLQLDHPYLIIKDLNMSPELLNPTLMDGDMSIQSLELKPGALDVSSTQPVKP